MNRVFFFYIFDFQLFSPFVGHIFSFFNLLFFFFCDKYLRFFDFNLRKCRHFMFDVMDKNFKRNYYSFNTEYIIYNLFNQQYRTSPSLFYLEMIPLYEILNDYFFISSNL